MLAQHQLFCLNHEMSQYEPNSPCRQHITRNGVNSRKRATGFLHWPTSSQLRILILTKYYNTKYQNSHDNRTYHTGSHHWAYYPGTLSLGQVTVNWRSGMLSFHIQVISLRLRWDRRHLADIFKCIFLNEKILISIKLSLKFIRNGPINNIPALVQIMAWRRPGDNPLSEPMAHMSHSASMSSRDWIHESIRASEWLSFNGLSWTADSYVHVVHISRVIIACTRIVAIAMTARPQAPLRWDSKSFKILGHKIWNGPSFITDKRLAEPALS